MGRNKGCKESREELAEREAKSIPLGERSLAVQLHSSQEIPLSDHKSCLLRFIFFAYEGFECLKISFSAVTSMKKDRGFPGAVPMWFLLLNA